MHAAISHPSIQLDCKLHFSFHCLIPGPTLHRVEPQQIRVEWMNEQPASFWLSEGS